MSSVKVKICGITQANDAVMAANLGAWAVGFNFYEGSPRYVLPQKVRAMLERLPDSVVSVGVFVNATLSQIKSIAKMTGIEKIQLHGDETPEFCRELAKATGLGVIKAFRLSSDPFFLSSFTEPEAFLIDAHVAGEYGGTGTLANWEFAREAKRYGKVILAGGLTADTIEQALVIVAPDGVDVASGVEINGKPGKKSPEKMEKFFEAVRKGTK